MSFLSLLKLPSRIAAILAGFGVVGGIFSYVKLGRMEDPSFTIREMMVTAAWPGASAEEMELQVTDKLESKITDLPGIDFIKSTTRSGSTVLRVTLKDEYKGDIRSAWRDVRNFCKDIETELPEGVYGPYYDDRFDDPLEIVNITKILHWYHSVLFFLVSYQERIKPRQYEYRICDFCVIDSIRFLNDNAVVPDEHTR